MHQIWAARNEDKLHIKDAENALLLLENNLESGQLMQAAREDKRISLIRQSKKEENAIE